MRMNNAKNTEDKLLLDGPCIVGRKTAGAGPAEELSGADVVASLPAASTSVDGKMTKEQAQSVANSAVAGSNGQVQLNNNGAMGASSSLVYNAITNALGIGTGNPTANHALDIVGGTPSIRQSVERPSGGVALSMFNLFARNTTSGLSSKYGEIGTYGTLNTSPTPPAPIYIYIGSTPTTAYNSATLKIDVNNRLGINLPSTNRPASTLDVGGAGTTSGITLQTSDSSGVVKFSVLDNGLLTTSGGSVVGYDTFTVDTTLTQSSKSCTVINPSGTGVVITMHLSPPNAIKQRTVNVSAFAVTLGRNSQKMAGLEANYTLSAYTAIDWHYYGATIGWIPISTSTW